MHDEHGGYCINISNNAQFKYVVMGNDKLFDNQFSNYFEEYGCAWHWYQLWTLAGHTNVTLHRIELTQIG